MFTTEVTTAPTTGAVSLSEAKRQVGIPDANSTHDALLTTFVMAATAAAQVFLGTLLMRQEVTLRAACLPTGAIDLPFYPVVSVDAVRYRDAEGTQRTMTAAETGGYWYSGSGTKYPWLAPVSTWPELQEGNPAAFEVDLTVGYEDEAAVPADVKIAVLMMVAELFANRGESTTGQVATPNTRTVESFLAPHRRRTVR